MVRARARRAKSFESRSRAHAALIGALLLGSWLLVSAALAEPFATELEWIHPDPSALRGFNLWLASSEEEKLAPIVLDVGLPLRGDRYAWGLQVDEQTPLFVAVVAVDRNGLVSAPSEWRRIDWRPGHGPLPEPGRPYLVEDRRR